MSKVHELYLALKQQGYDDKAAAKEAQARTGQSAVTGKPIKNVNHLKKYPSKFGGQYG